VKQFALFKSLLKSHLRPKSILVNTEKMKIYSFLIYFLTFIFTLNHAVKSKEQGVVLTVKPTDLKLTYEDVEYLIRVKK